MKMSGRTATRFAVGVSMFLVPLPQLASESAGHSTFHDWYVTLEHPTLKVPCCNSKDCRPVAFRLLEDGVEMWVGDRWLPIPDVRVFEETTPDGGAHWCGEGEQHQFPATYCAIIPRRRS